MLMDIDIQYALPDCNLLCSLTLDCNRPHKMRGGLTPKVNADQNFPY